MVIRRNLYQYDDTNILYAGIVLGVFGLICIVYFSIRLPDTKGYSFDGKVVEVRTEVVGISSTKRLQSILLVRDKTGNNRWLHLHRSADSFVDQLEAGDEIKYSAVQQSGSYYCTELSRGNVELLNYAAYRRSVSRFNYIVIVFASILFIMGVVALSRLLVRIFAIYKYNMRVDHSP